MLTQPQALQVLFGRDALSRATAARCTLASVTLGTRETLTILGGD